MKKLYEGNIRNNFLMFALPLVLTAIFSQAYNIINTIMAGKLIGDDAISAIGSTAPFISMISSVFWGYGGGLSVYVAMLFGKKDYRRMINVIKVNLLISSLIVILISVLCIIFHSAIFSFLNIEKQLWDAAYAYFKIYMSGLVFLHLNWCYLPIANAMGKSVFPFIASIISNLLNIFGNYVFIRYCGMKAEGTAYATALSAFVVSLFYLLIFLRTFKKEKIDVKGLYFSKEELSDSWNYSFPTMLQQSVMYMCTAFVSPLTNQCGAAAIAGYTIGMRLYDLNAAVYQNSNKTVGNFIAQCMGAKKYSLIREGIKTSLIQTPLFLLPFLLFTIFGADFISDIFLDETNSIHYSSVFMKYCMPFVIFNVINNLLHAIFRSVGSGKILVVSTVVYSVSRFIYSYILYAMFEMYGIYIAIVLSWITEAIFGLVIYFSGKWKRDELTFLES